jgi:hypothetical protein
VKPAHTGRGDLDAGQAHRLGREVQDVPGSVIVAFVTGFEAGTFIIVVSHMGAFGLTVFQVLFYRFMAGVLTVLAMRRVLGMISVFLILCTIVRLSIRFVPHVIRIRCL